MAVPSVFIRDDGRGFIVRKGGIDFDVLMSHEGLMRYFKAFGPGYKIFGEGDTIMEAVDKALAKVKDSK
jgi:hypothetical protein